MKAAEDTCPKRDALREVMARRKARRSVPVLSEGFEDNVMKQLAALPPVRVEKVVPPPARGRIWRLRMVGVAAAMVGIFLLLKTAMPEAAKETAPTAAAVSHPKESIRRIAEAESVKPVVSAVRVAETEVIKPIVSVAPVAEVQPQDLERGKVQRPRKASWRKSQQKNLQRVAADERAEAKSLVAEVEAVCIDCELNAMSDELTAMINEFENQ